MKNKKGFTLIELLAIIVILAIIAVITVPIILDIIDNSKKGAAKDSAYGYKDAINNYYLSKLSENFSAKELNGVYSIDNNGNLKKSENEIHVIGVSGQQPTNGYIIIKNNQVSGCLVYNDYAVTINNGDVSEAKKGDCKFATQTDAATIGELTIGDLVCINDTDECFYIISNENGITSMLARYSLNVGNNTQNEEYGKLGFQNSKAKGWNTDDSTKDSNGHYPAVVSFAGENYWCTNGQLNEKYGSNLNDSNIYDESYSNTPLYENIGGRTVTQNKGYSIAYYVKNYLIELEKKDLLIFKGRLLTYNEANEIKNIESSIIINNTTYWLGTTMNCENSINQVVYSVFGYGGISGINYSYGDNGGSVRPVIEIPTNEIKLRTQ